MPAEESKAFYLSIARDKQRIMEEIFDEIRDETVRILGSKRIGIFGPYRDKIQGVETKEIIRALTMEFVRKGYAVVTGLGIFMQRASSTPIRAQRTQLFDKFFRLITALKPKFAVKDLYKFLVTFAPNAMFLMTDARSTSIFEEESFFDNKYFDNELGVGFLVEADSSQECSYLKEKKIGTIEYWLCEGEVPSHCEKNEGKCPFYERGLNYASINMFVVSEFMQLAVTRDFNHIPTIIASVMGTP